ncbi:MAG: heme-dependent oxidative N-demethylase subunit alpha family protein [Ramlibacter sp.]
MGHCPHGLRLQPDQRAVRHAAGAAAGRAGIGATDASGRAWPTARRERSGVSGRCFAPPRPRVRSRAGLPFGPRDPPELAFEEDLAVLDGASGTLPWLCVCVPSHWAPEDKVGLDFAALHGPVADNAALVAASRQLVALVTDGNCWERHVWTISPSGRYDQHPRRHDRTPWPDAADPRQFADRCWLRAERQTFFPVGQGTRQAVFTIRVMLQPLPQAVAQPWQARRLRDSLASMSAAVLAYKNLAPARQPLLRWLETRA